MLPMRAILLLLFLCQMCRADGLDGKVMCGYQGWFRVPEDGSQNGWHHYSPGKTFEPGKCGIDLWPDVRELAAEERFATGFKMVDGSVAEVFSSVRRATVQLHFQWMLEYGIDGVFLQRFVASTRDPRFRKPADEVLDSCRSAATATGRCWALMYDLSGIKPGETELVIADWKRLEAQMHLRDSRENPAYLRLREKPLVALWGLGFNDRAPILDEWRRLIEFFKKDAALGGCAVMVGVPAYWRTLERDAIHDPALLEVVALADVVSPWNVGRFSTPVAATAHAAKVETPDIAWCRERGLGYLPVAFPGFSWHNLSASRGKDAPLNAIPRLGGRFLWAQCVGAHAAGAKGLYVAMFDEMDEGTAIFKVRSDVPAGVTEFVIEPDVPGDEYLWLTGQAGRLLRGEVKGTEFPVR